MSLLYALLIVLPAMALAQVDLKPYNLTATALFLNIDTNQNGEITLQEIDASFRGYDANHNGRVSRQEYTSYVDAHQPELHPLSHALYDIYDVDSDDQLDLHDFENFHKLMDGDGSGIVSHFEFVRYWSILFTDLEHLHAPNKKNVVVHP
ncbi:uncharacterized protein LOC131945947 isoform X3 [Physella acuta]|uniref:uncharacterized protein LOC131945947 isoform X3 n=1 Tax=Physella acuta TaxID=109671 RepID=UPI0027DB8752|nr:uncharacterized protein LOC131945947 isoform X3 [Physella acuta]